MSRIMDLPAKDVINSVCGDQRLVLETSENDFRRRRRRIPKQMSGEVNEERDECCIDFCDT